MAGHALFLWPPQDLLTAERYQIIPGTLPVEDLAFGAAFNGSEEFAMAMAGRVKTWTLRGTATIAPGTEETASGNIEIECHAVSFVSTEREVQVVDEHGLCKWGGYYGEIPSLEGWTTGAGGPLGSIPGPISLRLWPSLVRELDGAIGFPAPVFNFPFAVGPATFGLAFGSSFGGCPCVMTLPVTREGSFDGTDFIMKNLQIGAVGDTGDLEVNGFFELVPKVGSGYWPHDPEDGDGAFFDAGTGAHLRDPFAADLGG